METKRYKWKVSVLKEWINIMKGDLWIKTKNIQASPKKSHYIKLLVQCIMQKHLISPSHWISNHSWMLIHPMNLALTSTAKKISIYLYLGTCRFSHIQIQLGNMTWSQMSWALQSETAILSHQECNFFKALCLSKRKLCSPSSNQSEKSMLINNIWR